MIFSYITNVRGLLIRLVKRYQTFVNKLLMTKNK